MNWQGKKEGYLMIDHRASPGISEEFARANPGFRAVPEGRLFESATSTCSHCQRLIVLNPDRVRERGYCPKCNHYVCDRCEAVRVASGWECRSFERIMNESLEAAIKRGEA
jgi:hypothetical protein